VERRDDVKRVFRLTVIPGLDLGIPMHAVVWGDPRIRSGDDVGPGDDVGSGDDVGPGDDVERRDDVERAVGPSKSSSDGSFILMSVGDIAAVSRTRPSGRGET
jgi:hypothetical protein